MEPSASRGFVYVIKAAPLVFQVGFSRAHPEQQLARLQASHHRILGLVYLRPHDRAGELERLALSLLKAWRIRGNWVRCPLEQILAAMDTASKKTPERRELSLSNASDKGELSLHGTPQIASDNNELIDLGLVAPSGHDAVRDDLAAAYADNTKRAYAADWADFRKWCEVERLGCLPAGPETVARYAKALAASAKMSTVTRRVAAIAFFHKIAGEPFDRKAPAIDAAMRRLRREKGTAKAGRDALMTDDILAMLKVLPRTGAGLRDRAILLIGYAGGFRRDELAAICHDHIEWRRDGIIITVPKSKGDQVAEGQRVGILYGKREASCPLRTLKAWMAHANISSGPLFRSFIYGRLGPGALRPNQLWRMVKATAAGAGIAADRISTHSLRIGHVTQAIANGAPAEILRQQLRHARLDTTLGYDRNRGLSADNTSGKLGL